MMLMLQYPLLPAASLLCAALAALAVIGRRLWLCVCTALLTCGMLLAALFCMLPYAETLLLLLLPLLVCLALVTKGDAA